jgi:hypothetical protein
MCLLFFGIGAIIGYLYWRVSNIPRLLDAEEECAYWRVEWAKLKAENDAMRGLND